jgi:hypothetical protein
MHMTFIMFSKGGKVRLMVDLPHFYELVNELTSIPCFSLGPSSTSIPNGKAQRKVKMW